MSSIQYSRPAFWKFPTNKDDHLDDHLDNHHQNGGHNGVNSGIKYFEHGDKRHGKAGGEKRVSFHEDYNGNVSLYTFFLFH